MHPLLIAAACLLGYAIGFAVTARITIRLARRPGSDLLDHEVPVIAMLWPLTLAVLLTAGPLVLLYRWATKGLHP